MYLYSFLYCVAFQNADNGFNNNNSNNNQCRPKIIIFLKLKIMKSSGAII